MLIACSSPSIYSGVIWKNYLKGSRGEWCLSCLNCGSLYSTKQLAWRLEDGKYAGLQWDKTEAGDVEPDSIRWICPCCHHEHTEDMAQR